MVIQYLGVDNKNRQKLMLYSLLSVPGTPITWTPEKDGSLDLSLYVETPNGNRDGFDTATVGKAPLGY